MIPRSAPSRASRLVLPGLLVALASLAASCDSVPLTAPTQSTIVLFANANNVALHASADITAIVNESGGTPVQNGTVVTFSTTLGTIDPSDARTHNGRVTVKFNAGGLSGTARISAFSGPANATALELKIGGAAATRVQLTAEPAQVPSTGGTVDLIATVTDDDGNRLSGVPVTFTASAGRLGSTSVTTDGAGVGRTTLTTDRETTVSAIAGGAQSQQVTIRANQAPSVNISVTTSNPQSGQPVNFSISVTAGTNSSAVREVVVDFGDGTRESLGRVTGTQSITHVFLGDGSYRVTATVTDTSGEQNSTSTVVVVVPVQVSMNLNTSPLFPRVNTPVTVTVTISPSNVRIVRYDFDFGDGTVASQSNNTINKIYTSTGVFTIVVTAVTSDGQAITARADISVTI
jgi:heat shock protein HslJ